MAYESYEHLCGPSIGYKWTIGNKQIAIEFLSHMAMAENDAQ